MNTGVGSIGAFFLEKSKRGSLRRTLAVGLLSMGLILTVGGKVKIVRLGYQIQALEQQKEDLERINRSLRIEASSLSAPERIEKIAVERLGMVRPSKKHVVVVKRKK